jgi:SAM-dependent methyltransferase
MNAFVSLSHHDVTFAKTHVLPALGQVGVSPWIYEATVPGDNWIEAVLQRIKDGDWFVVVLTQHYQASIQERRGACYNELLWIVDQVSTSRRRCRLIVIRHDGEVPDLLRTWQAIDVRNGLALLANELERAAAADREQSPVAPVASSRPCRVRREVPRPSVNSPLDLPDLARFNFNNIAARYQTSLTAGKPMQRDNAEVLLQLFNATMNQGRARRPEAWLDAGCGTGLIAALLDDWKDRNDFNWMNDCRMRAGFDYAPVMLDIACDQNEHGHWYTHTFEGDLRTFGSDTLMRHTGLGKVDLVIANNVFHWLFTEDMIEKAFRRLYEVLDRNGGCLAASIAAEGTGSEFFTAYCAEVEDKIDAAERERWQRHLKNPIGLQRLSAIVDIAKRCRFRIERAQQAYEPKEYDRTDLYVRDVRAYGEEVLMAPLQAHSKDDREQVWKGIARRFKELHDAKFNQTRYVHNQFVIYLLAIRHD